MRISGARLGSVAVALVAALVLAACGDDDSSADADSTGTAPSSAPRPTGPPIEIGVMNTENSPAGNYLQGRQGIEAAAEYINSELGGVNGRPISLESCVTNGSPETSIACANRFVREKKVAVMPHLELGAPGAMPIFQQAGMPYVGGSHVSAEEYAMPTSFSFTGGAPGIAGVSTYIGQTLKPKKVGVLFADIPAGRSAGDLFVRSVLAQLGVTDVNIVYESPAAADFTPAVTRANEGNPDVILVSYGGSPCSAIMQATRALGIQSSKMIYVLECGGKDQIAAGGGGGEGALFSSFWPSPDSDDANVVTYRDKLSKYAEAAPVGFSTQAGFNNMMNFYAVLKKLDPNNITSQSIVDALKSTRNEPGFMSHPFTCDGQQFPNFTSVCDAHSRILKFENGSFSETTGDWVTPLTNIGGR